MRETFVYDYGIAHDLATEGSFSVTAQSLLDGIGYIPESVVSDLQKKIYLNEDDDVDTTKYNEIKFT